MADQLHYVPGDNYALDDLSGFKIRTRKARLIPGGITGNALVDPKRWEPQQPQDFVTGVDDDQTVSVSRPRQQNQFTITGCAVTAPAAPGATSLTVDSATGFAVGNVCQVVLDNGNVFRFTLSAVGAATLTFAGYPLPSAVGGNFSDPLENAVILVSAS